MREGGITQLIGGGRRRTLPCRETEDPAFLNLPTRIGRHEWCLISTVVLLALGAPATLASVAGSFGTPHNDDFTFIATALDYRQTGGFRLGGDEHMVLIGHVLWGQPFLRLFGDGVVALHVAGLAAAGIGLVACFLLLRRLSDLASALLGTACIALLPGYALLSGSFMTDITAFAGQMVCVTLGVAALDRHGGKRAALLTASCAAGVAAFSSRQTAIPALVAVVTVVIWQSSQACRNGRTLLVELAIVAGAFGAVLSLSIWRFSLPGQLQPFSAPPTVANLFTVLAAISTLALFVVPLSWAAVRALLDRASGRRCAVVAAAMALPWLALPLTGHDLLLGNLFTRRGANDGVIGGVKEDIFAGSAWLALQVLSLLALFCLLTWLCHALWTSLPAFRHFTRDYGDAALVLLVVFTVLAFAAAVAPAARNTNIFDRYLWAPGAGLVGLLVRAVPGRSRCLRGTASGAAGLLGVLALVTAVSITESISFDRARWRAGERAVASGTPAGLVDAGYDWTGHHASRSLSRQRPEAALTAVNWWSQVYAAGLPCVVVTASPLQDARYSLERKPAYDPPLSPSRRLFVYRLLEPCGAGAPAPD